MIERKSVGERIFDVLNIIFMLVVIVVTIYPMYYVLVCSLSEGSKLIGARGLIIWPKGYSLSAYASVFKNPNIFTGYRTTLIVVVLGTLINLIMTSLGAFLITRKQFPLSGFMSYMMIFTMYFGGGMIPTYLVINNYYHLGDSLLALLLPGAINVYNLLIMKSNFQSLPDSLEEAAKVDGANDFRIFLQIVLPLSQSVLAVMVLYYGVAHWNAWFDAMMYMRTRTRYPLQLILREILLANNAATMGGGGSAGEQYMIGESVKYATIITATLPILCLYPFIQKYFVKGVMVGAVKG